MNNNKLNNCHATTLLYTLFGARKHGVDTKNLGKRSIILVHIFEDILKNSYKISIFD
jgi:hypothetical protein